jgi:peptide/nickel transport system permease protein
MRNLGALTILREIKRNWIAAVAGATLLFIIGLAIFAPAIMPQNPYDLSQLNLLDGRLPPGAIGDDGMRYWLGTDDQGRDILSGIVFGLRTSLLVGLVSALIAGSIGAMLGLLAAYLGGVFDATLMRVVDMLLSFPVFLTAMIILAILGKGLGNVILALVIIEWAYYARTVRSVALSERKREYMEAATALCLPKWRVLFVHLMPNSLPPLIVIAGIQVARAISTESTLSFLGLGVPVTEPSLGKLISNGNAFLMSGQYWISVYPGIALVATIVAINLFVDELRDTLNPKNRS